MAWILMQGEREDEKQGSGKEERETTDSDEQQLTFCR